MAAAFSPFDNELWAYINLLKCDASSCLINQVPQVDFRMYPNPANQTLHIFTSVMNSSISVHNMFGETLLLVKPEVGSSSLDISQLATGVYFVEIITEKSKFCQKLIINR